MDNKNVQIRLNDADVATFAALADWYPSLGRTAIIRLALAELARVSVGAPRRYQEVAQHMPSYHPVKKDKHGRIWTADMDAIKQERRSAGLPGLAYGALLAEATARKLTRDESE